MANGSSSNQTLLCYSKTTRSKCFSVSGRISESLFASLKAAGTSSRVVARVFKVSVHFTYNFL